MVQRKLMLSCRESSRLLSDRLDRPLDLWERLALRAHLSMCVGCSRADAQLRFLRRAIAGMVASSKREDPKR